MKKVLLLLSCFILLNRLNAQTVEADSIYFTSHYIKMEEMIPMRDGIKLYTAIYIPRDSLSKHPVLLKRTPYDCAPYGKEFIKLWHTYFMKYCREQYIMVYQDVRGRYMSEGDFIDVRPYQPSKNGTDTDEASDTYDTIEWLINHLPGNNGKVGVYGISYPGFYASMAALSGHPALKAVSPQAPVTDWFIGDDFHHNGAFMLIDAFSFFTSFGVKRPFPTKTYQPGYEIEATDKFQFFLNTGPLPNFNKKYLKDSIYFWNELMNQPVYNNWWQSRNPVKYFNKLPPAMLVVGGLFDAEDLYGTWKTYQGIEAGNPSSHFNKIVMGPWFHGTWEGRSSGEMLGDARFGSKTSKWYQDSVEFPFFQQFLNNVGNNSPLAEATIFFTGQNQWKRLAQWPPRSIKYKPIYLLPEGHLSFNPPKKAGTKDEPAEVLTFTSYVSDPASPVPHEGPGTIKLRTREYMTADQRFTRHRNDVTRFETGRLSKELTLAGPVVADLWVNTSATDIDLVVKIIDVFPPDINKNATGPDTLYKDNPKMNNYEMLVRGEIIRGKFRNSFEHPEPFIPGKITRVKFTLPDVAHTFLRNHKLMIQVQSSWFPLADRNPQTFVDIYKASEKDFKKAIIRIFHAEGTSSNIILPVLE